MEQFSEPYGRFKPYFKDSYSNKGQDIWEIKIHAVPTVWF